MASIERFIFCLLLNRMEAEQFRDQSVLLWGFIHTDMCIGGHDSQAVCEYKLDQGLDMLKGNQKLRPDEVICIRGLKNTTSIYRIAKTFNVSRRAITQIIGGKNYSYLPLDPEVNFSLLLPKKEEGIRICKGGCNRRMCLTEKNFYKKKTGRFYSHCKKCMKRQSKLNWEYIKEVKRREKALSKAA